MSIFLENEVVDAVLSQRLNGLILINILQLSNIPVYALPDVDKVGSIDGVVINGTNIAKRLEFRNSMHHVN